MLSFLSLVKVDGSDHWDLVMVDDAIPSHGRFCTLQIDQLFDSLKARLRPVDGDVKPMPVPTLIKKPIVKKVLAPTEFAPGKCHGFDAIGRRCGRVLVNELHCKKHDLEAQIASGLVEPVKTLVGKCHGFDAIGRKCGRVLVTDLHCKKHALEAQLNDKTVVVLDDSVKLEPEEKLKPEEIVVV